jgi:flavin-binding protein dodecin
MTPPRKEKIMAIVKVIEVLAQSDQSWEEATREALREASKTVKGIQNIYIKEFQAIVENDQIVNFRINAKISFIVQGDVR